MANFTFTIAFEDEDGHVSRLGGSLVRVDLAAATAALQAIAEAADVLSGARVLNVSLTAQMDTTAWTLKASAAAGSDVEIGGRFIMHTGVTNFLANLTVPGFLKDLYTTTGGFIDTAAAEVLAFISALSVNGASTSHWEDLIALQTGYETFNGKR